LTDRQINPCAPGVATAILCGPPYVKQIASELDLSVSAVQLYLRSARHKLRCSSNAEMTTSDFDIRGICKSKPQINLL
jgi:DNA-binding NarL/FixJ family response regulator